MAVIPPCIKLHITASTTARDVISSVVRKLRRQGLGDELGREEGTHELGLVACVAGNVTHHIPDSVNILGLGQPWVSAQFHLRFLQ